jgi:hypothetical protein
MSFSDSFNFDDSSPRVRRQFGDLFDPGDPNPRYESDQFARGDDFGVKPITMQDYAAPPQESRYDKYMSGMKDLYGTHPSLDRYNQFLQNAPKAEDYRPSKWERLAAGLGGISEGFKDPAKGIATAIGLNRSRYNTAMEDYQNMAKPMAEAATIERQGIADKAKYMSDVNDLMYKQQTLQRQQRADESLDQYRQRLTTQGDKRLGLEERNINSLIPFRQNQNKIGAYQAETGRYAAQTGRINAGTQQGMLGVARDNANTNWFNAANKPFGGQHGPTPQGLSTATADVMANMKSSYPDVIHQDIRGDYSFAAPPDVNSPAYPAYLKARQQIQEMINSQARTGQMNLFGGGSPSGGGGYGQFGDVPDPNEFGDFTDLGPDEQ